MNNKTIVLSLSMLCALFIARVGFAVEVTATDFAQTTIYHSPQTPGYTAWCNLWQAGDGGLRAAFQQVTGPIDAKEKRKNVTVIIGSADQGATWKTIREVPARPAQANAENNYAASASSAFCGHGLVALADGTLVTGLWPGGEQKSGYIQRSKDDGHTWSSPIYFLDPEIYKTYPTQIHQLHDGRLVLVAGTVKQADATTAKYLLKEFFESRDGGKTWSHIWTMPADVGLCEESDFIELDSGDLLFVHRAEHYEGNKYITSDRLQNIFHHSGDKWEIGPVQPTPMPHSGYPELLKTRAGIVLHIATDGIWWTADAGAHWQRLGLRGNPRYLNATPSPSMPPYPDTVLGSPYYPRALQMKDGTILVIGHNGSDDEYGKVDEAIVQQTFRLEVTPAAKP